MSSKHGPGGVYLRGSTYWIRFSHHGHEIRVSAHTTSERVAQRYLSRRIKEAGARGASYRGAEDRVRFADLASMLRQDYSVNDRKSLRRIEGALRHLTAHFGLDRAIDISTDRITAYKESRQEDEAANATVNRELSALKRAFRLAVISERLTRAPYIAMLPENNARQGFVNSGDFTALLEALPEWLRDPIEFLWLSGWRVSEMRTLEWRDIDMHEQAIRLRPENSKNGEGRFLPFSSETDATAKLAPVVERAQGRRRLDLPQVFHNNGRAIPIDFRYAWEPACKSAGLDGLLVHDLRRSAVRNMVQSGISESQAMKLSGHKTRAIFDRYNIIVEEDLVRATRRRDAYLDAQPTTRKVTKLKPS